MAALALTVFLFFAGWAVIVVIKRYFAGIKIHLQHKTFRDAIHTVSIKQQDHYMKLFNETHNPADAGRADGTWELLQKIEEEYAKIYGQ